MSDKVIETLTAHALYYDDIRDNERCGCGWTPDYEAINYTESAKVPAHEALNLQHAAHQVAMLSAAGIECVELPEAELDCTTPTFDAGCGAITHAQPDGDVRLHSVVLTLGRFGGMFRSPRKARELAGALLAASAAVERNRNTNHE